MIGVAVLAVIAGAVATGQGSGGSSSDSDSTIPAVSAPGVTEPEVSASDDGPTGLSQHAEDVSIMSCVRDSMIGWGAAKVHVTNGSGKPSNYMITVVFESADGSQQYGTGFAFVDTLSPGQSVVEEVSSLREAPATVTCRLTQAERHAA